MPTYMHHFQCVLGEACLQYHTARRTQQRLAVSGQRRGQRLQQKAATKCNRATLACVLVPSSALTSPDTCQLNHLASLEPACARGVGRGGVGGLGGAGGVGEGKGWWVHCVHTLVGSRAYARNARICTKEQARSAVSRKGVDVRELGSGVEVHGDVRASERDKEVLLLAAVPHTHLASTPQCRAEMWWRSRR
jgi:hypothetical protein